MMNKEEYKEQFGILLTENADLKKQVLDLTMEIAELKDKLAHYPYTPTDGLEVGNPSDYEDPRDISKDER